LPFAETIFEIKQVICRKSHFFQTHVCIWRPHWAVTHCNFMKIFGTGNPESQFLLCSVFFLKTAGLTELRPVADVHTDRQTDRQAQDHRI